MLIKSIVLLLCMSEINTSLKYVHQFGLPQVYALINGNGYYTTKLT